MRLSPSHAVALAQPLSLKAPHLLRAVPHKAQRVLVLSVVARAQNLADRGEGWRWGCRKAFSAGGGRQRASRQAARGPRRTRRKLRAARRRLARALGAGRRTCMPMTSLYQAVDFSRSPTRSMTWREAGGGMGMGGSWVGWRRRAAAPRLRRRPSSHTPCPPTRHHIHTPPTHTHLAQRLLRLGALDELPLVPGGVLSKGDDRVAALDRPRLARDLACECVCMCVCAPSRVAGAARQPRRRARRSAPRRRAASGKVKASILRPWPRTLPPPPRMVSASLYTSGVETPKWPKPWGRGV